MIATTTTFAPPTAEQVLQHLDRYPPHRPSGLAVWLPLLVLAVTVVLSILIDDAAIQIFLWLALGAVFVSMIWRARRGRNLEQRLLRVQEQAMLRHWTPSLREVWRLLPQLTAAPELHGRAVALMAYNLDQTRAYEAAITAYDYLIDNLPEEHPASVQLRVHRAIAHLLTDRLGDADDALRRLRGAVENLDHAAITAAYRLARLFQDVRTHHFADAAADGRELVAQLRPLGMEAAYGYALLALAHQRLAQADPQGGHRAQAGAWWERATLLLEPRHLVHRFPELAALVEASST